MTDYRTLLARAAFDTTDLTTNRVNDAIAAAILATRIPWLCPDCKGDVGYVTEHLEPCFCPSAPTIADLLQWGEQYRKVRADLDHVVSCPEVWCDLCELIESDTLAALRGEGQ